MVRPGFAVLAMTLMTICATTGVAAAQDGANVLVVVNQARPSAAAIAARYVTARSVPEANLLQIRTATTDEIDRAHFEREIQQPIADWLTHHNAQDQVLFLVLVKGIPLRVAGSEGREGTVASVDSELTLLYRKLLGLRVPATGRIANPYFQADHPISGARQFSHAAQDIYLVSRLDAFTDEDVVRLIDRSISAGRTGQLLFDERASPLGERVGDAWLESAAKSLTDMGLGERVVLETSPQLATANSPVLGYFSWGSNDPAITKRQLGLTFAPGALAATFVSTDGRTLNEPPASWSPSTAWQDPKSFFAGSPQSLMGDLIREGATGVAGHVAEPYLDGTIRPQILFPAYMSGFSLAESFYLAMPSVSWQTVVVGDPLCAPFRKDSLPADQRMPAIDAETELPVFFSLRRLASLSASGVGPQAAKPFLKALSRIAHDDKPAAVLALESATSADPKFVDAQFTLAVLYEGNGDYDAAIERYRAILATAPNEIRSLNNLAYTLAVRKGAPADALALAEKAYKLSSGNASVADTLGWIRHLLGNDSEAERLLTGALKTTPENPEIHLHLAEVYVATNRRDLALAELNNAIGLDPALKERDDVRKLRARIGGA